MSNTTNRSPVAEDNSEMHKSFMNESFQARGRVQNSNHVYKLKDKETSTVNASSLKTPKSIIYSKLPAKSLHSNKVKITKPSVTRDEAPSNKTYERKSSIGQYRYSHKWPYMPFGQQENKEIIEHQMNSAGRTSTQ